MPATDSWVLSRAAPVVSRRIAFVNLPVWRILAWIMDPDGNKVELWEPMLWDDKNKEA